MEKPAATVFVVDDDSTVRKALARLFRSLGMQVETFASAREFLTGGRPDGPACLILDVRLPGENGLLVHQSLQTAPVFPAGDLPHGARDHPHGGPGHEGGRRRLSPEAGR